MDTWWWDSNSKSWVSMLPKLPVMLIYLFDIWKNNMWVNVKWRSVWTVFSYKQYNRVEEMMLQQCVQRTFIWLLRALNGLPNGRFNDLTSGCIAQKMCGDIEIYMNIEAECIPAIMRCISPRYNHTSAGAYFIVTSLPTQVRREFVPCLCQIYADRWLNVWI